MTEADAELRRHLLEDLALRGDLGRAIATIDRLIATQRRLVAALQATADRKSWTAAATEVRKATKARNVLEAHRLRAEGLSIAQTAERMGATPRAVQKWRAAEKPPNDREDSDFPGD